MPNSQLSTLNSQLRGAWVALAIFTLLGSVSYGQNVKVVNPDSSPAAVKVLSNYTSPSVTSRPGTTPSPSPAMVVNVQGNASGIPLPVTGTVKQLTGVPSSFTPATADTTVFTLAAGEIGFIQNLDDAPLMVKKGASASTSSFSFVLAAGTAADDGKGGAVRIDDWVGAVSVAAGTGTARYIAWKVAP